MHKYQLSSHSHKDHFHFNLFNVSENSSHQHSNECRDSNSKKSSIGKNDEGCPCCLAAIDLDELAVALNQLGNSNGSSNAENHSHSAFELADFSSPTHWGIFLGISGPLALIGLTAAYRNIKGTLNNKQKLELLINGLQSDIEKK